MRVELVRTRTVDGLRLDGALQVTLRTPQAASDAVESDRSSVDAVLLLPGVGGNFYGSTLLQTLATELLGCGISVLRANTRGHDGVTTIATLQGSRLQGAAYEIVDECRHDLEAWIQFLVHRGFRRIGLVGHSLGAIKILYSQAYQPHAAVARLVAISPPRLAYSRFLQGTEQASFEQSLNMAKRWITQLQPQMLFQSSFPFPIVLSAQTFMDKYGPEERYNLLKFVTQIAAPLSFVYGEVELSQASSSFLGIKDDLFSLAWRFGEPGWQLVTGANHFFTGRLAELAATVREELTSL